MEINCEFKSFSAYTCIIKEANITERDHEIKEFKGVHEPGKSHNDVREVSFIQGTVDYFPRGLNKHFPNLTYLQIFGGGIKEISRNSLKGLEGLVELYLDFCQLTSLPDDLFTEMPNLRAVSFYGNKIEFASSEVLKPLFGGKNVRVNLRNNKNIDAWFKLRSDGPLKSLEELMKLSDRKCMEPAKPEPVISNSKLKKMWVSGRFSDLTIIAGAKEFKVHKNILEMQSEVFGEIFEDQHEATEMKISEFSSKSVEALLKFIYTNENSKDGNAKENFEIADKFKVEAMKSIYEKIIGEQINEENAWETFLFAHRFSSQQLKKKAFKLIMKKIPEAMPDKLMEDPENLKIMIDARRVYEEVMAKIKLVL